MNEDQILDAVTVRQLIAELPREEDRIMMRLYYEIEDIPDYTGPLPPTFASVAQYVGKRFCGAPLAESTIRYRVRTILARWREVNGSGLRR